MVRLGLGGANSKENRNRNRFPRPPHLLEPTQGVKFCQALSFALSSVESRAKVVCFQEGRPHNPSCHSEEVAGGDRRGPISGLRWSPSDSRTGESAFVLKNKRFLAPPGTVRCGAPRSLSRNNNEYLVAALLIYGYRLKPIQMLRMTGAGGLSFPWVGRRPI